LSESSTTSDAAQNARRAKQPDTNPMDSPRPCSFRMPHGSLLRWTSSQNYHPRKDAISSGSLSTASQRWRTFFLLETKGKRRPTLRLSLLEKSGNTTGSPRISYRSATPDSPPKPGGSSFGCLVYPLECRPPPTRRPMGKLNASTRPSRYTSGRLSVTNRTSGWAYSRWPNSPTIIRSLWAMGCLHSTPITGSILYPPTEPPLDL